MQNWIALFRGINVGGRNRVPMKQLTATLESIGCRSVQTYIQSGNVVFSSSLKAKRNLAQRIGNAVESEFGFPSKVLLLTKDDFVAAVNHNPFAAVQAEPKSLHFFFLDAVPIDPDLDGLNELAKASERFDLVGKTFYLHTPDGFARSRLATQVERKLGVSATARNFTTVSNLLAMLDSVEPKTAGA